MLELAPQCGLRRLVNSRFFPGRFKFLRKYPTEQAACTGAWYSIDNFLPLLGYVSMGLWFMQAAESVACSRIEEPPDWRQQVAEKTGIYHMFLDYLVDSIKWKEERIGTLYCIQSPKDFRPEEREQRGEIEWLLTAILCSNFSIPIYISWGNLPKEIHTDEVPEAFCQFVPDEKELEYLASRDGKMKFSRWAVDNREANLKKIANESSSDRQRRTSRADNAKLGAVPKKASVFLWENQNGYWIRQSQTRGESTDLWSEYPGPERRFDPLHNEWDLCTLFKNNNTAFGEGYDHPADDGSDNEMDPGDPVFPQDINMESRLPPDVTNMEVVPERHPRDVEALIVDLDYEDLGPDTESDIPPIRNLAQASRKTEKPEYESIAADLSGSLLKRFGFVMPSTPDTFVAREPPEERLASEHLANVIGIPNITHQLPSQKGLENTLGIFFGQCIGARSANSIDKVLLDYHQPHLFSRRPSPFQIGRECLKSMRNPSQCSWYYVLRRIGSGIGSEVLWIPRVTGLVEVIRQEWGPAIKDVVAHFVARGIPFWLAYASNEIMPASQPVGGLHPKGFKADTSSGLGFRPHQHTFDEHDYNGHITQRDVQFLHTPRARIALQYGGVLARLARSEVSDEDFFRLFDEEIYDVGDCLWDGQSQHSYWYYRLAEREIDLLCGVYHLGTGQKKTGGNETDDQTSTVSWWPKPNAWACGNLDGAWWTPQCENNFFAKRLAHFAKGVYLPQNQTKWRHNLKFKKEVKKCWVGYEVVANSIVRDLIASGEPKSSSSSAGV
ncbi:hypothetical protein B0H13DRAFT_2314613 [Mycena leptocephala]|nr:hypothetical protein B0H13DRAFT_2314613 [Mycena leptocephala]